MAKILLIEDDPQHTMLAKLRLESEGFEVVSAKTGAESVAAASLAPDLILLDLILPDIGPLEMIKALRAVPAAASTPIVVFSVMDYYEIHRKGLEPEIAGLIPKPYDTVEMLEEIHRVLKEYALKPEVRSY